MLRHSPGSGLLRTVYNLLLSCVSVLPLLMTIPACTGPAENGTEQAQGQGREEDGPAADSTDFIIELSVDPEVEEKWQAAIGRTDIFIYGGSGTRQLEKHLQTSGTGRLTVRCRSGDRITAAIANSRAGFNMAALQKYDSMELLRYGAEDDDPARPLMSAVTETAGDSVRLVLKPLGCRIILAEITNELGGYVRLEEPRIGLFDRSPSAEVFRTDGFRPVEIPDDTAWVKLPYDIGVLPQTPGTELWCYPNDTPEETMGTPRTGIVLECVIEGRRERFRGRLPPLARGSTTGVGITVSRNAGGPPGCSYRFF